MELILRSMFGDLVEANGHLFQVDPNDRTLGVLMRRRGVLSPAETELYSREVRPGMTVVDIGANIGYFTLLFARCAGSDGRVVAFEPEPSNFELLRRNIEYNGYANVVAVPCALSRSGGTAKLLKSPFNFGDHRLGHGEPGRAAIDVKVTTLDDYFTGREPKVDFIKMDIQGAERAALHGARRTIERSTPLAIATEFWPEGMRAFGDDPRAFLDDLQRLGFMVSILSPGRPLEPVGDGAALDRLARRDDTVELFCRKA